MNTFRYDIAVIGGGFAGAAAGICAARRGKKVLLIEKYNCMGGAAAFDLVNPFMPYWTWNPENTKEQILLSKGLFGEITERLQAMGGLHAVNGMTFNEELLKYLLNTMAIESGLDLLYGTSVTAVNKEGKRIRSVHVSNVSGVSEIEADCFIDATGDANIAALADCPYRLGRDSDRLCQPMTLSFRLANVHAEYTNDIKNRINDLYKQFKTEGKIKNPREDILMFQTLIPNVYHFNATRVIKRNPTDAWDVTRAEIEAREQVMELFRFLHDNFEEFKDSVLLSTGLQIGARESRMIEGEYVLTEKDLLDCRRFEDSIAVCNYEIDIHSPDGAGTSHYFFPHGKYYTIPYRCLLPKNADNLLVAGRCVSATHEAQASLRIMPTCATLGEAAGLAATLVCDQKCAARDVSVPTLQALLRENGARID